MVTGLLSIAYKSESLWLAIGRRELGLYRASTNDSVSAILGQVYRPMGLLLSRVVASVKMMGNGHSAVEETRPAHIANGGSEVRGSPSLCWL